MNRSVSFGLILLLLVTAGCVTTHYAFVPDIDLVEEPMPREKLTTTVLVPEPILTAADSGDLKFGLNVFFAKVICAIKPDALSVVEMMDKPGKKLSSGGKSQRMATRIMSSYGYGKTVKLHMQPCLQTVVLDASVGVRVSGTAMSSIYWSLRAYEFQPGQYRIAGR